MPKLKPFICTFIATLLAIATQRSAVASTIDCTVHLDRLNFESQQWQSNYVQMMQLHIAYFSDGDVKKPEILQKLLTQSEDELILRGNKLIVTLIEIDNANGCGIDKVNTQKMKALVEYTILRITNWRNRDLH